MSDLHQSGGRYKAVIKIIETHVGHLGGKHMLVISAS